MADAPQSLEDDFRDMVANALMSRAELFRQFLDPRRNIYAECGYTEGYIAPEAYQMYFDRMAIAARFVEVFPKECFKVQPYIVETEDDKETKWEGELKEVGRKLRGEQSRLVSNSNPLNDYALRVDVLSGIGQYGVMLFGIDDGRALREPADLKFSSEVRHDLLYIRCLPEVLCPIASYDMDTSSPRFGMPLEYTVTFNDPRETTQAGTGLTTKTEAVHWTRVVHVMDHFHTAPTSPVFAVQRLRPVINDVQDLQKLYGGSAEMYWRGAFPGLSLETNPQLGSTARIDKPGIRDSMEQYMNGLQRYLLLTGMTAKTLSPTVVDPTPQIATRIEAICVKGNIPVPVFKGYEIGEQASTNNATDWANRVKGRQELYVTPSILGPMVDRLMLLGVLSEVDEYYARWPDLTQLSAIAKADLAGKRVAAYAGYIGGNVQSLVPPFHFLTRDIGMEDEEADQMLKDAEELQEKEVEVPEADPEAVNGELVEEE